MERRVVITGAGLVSPLGDSPGEVHAALLAGRSALGPITRFPTTGLLCAQAGEIRDFDPRSCLGSSGGKSLAPLDRISRLVAVAAQRALADSGWTAGMRAAREVGIVLGTMLSGVHTIAEFDRRGLTLGPAYVSPLDFANTVINAAAGQTAIWHDLRGVNSTVAGGETAALQAIGCAVDLIRSGHADALLAGGADELCFETFLGFYRAGRLCGSLGGGDFPIPFDARRNGFALAEGVALVVLEEAESARRRGARILAEVSGHGAAFDSARGGDPARAARAVERAVRLALADAGLAVEAIDAVSSGANGSIAGDRATTTGLATVLAGRAGEIPVTAVKANLGETLGAAGAFQLIDLLATMADGVLPGITGLEKAEDGVALALAAEPRSVAVRCGVVEAVAGDGHAAALVVAAAEAP